MVVNAEVPWFKEDFIHRIVNVHWNPGGAVEIKPHRYVQSRAPATMTKFAASVWVNLPARPSADYLGVQFLGAQHAGPYFDGSGIVTAARPSLNCYMTPNTSDPTDFDYSFASFVTAYSTSPTIGEFPSRTISCIAGAPGLIKPDTWSHFLLNYDGTGSKTMHKDATFPGAGYIRERALLTIARNLRPVPNIQFRALGGGGFPTGPAVGLTQVIPVTFPNVESFEQLTTNRPSTGFANVLRFAAEPPWSSYIVGVSGYQITGEAEVLGWNFPTPGDLAIDQTWFPGFEPPAGETYTFRLSIPTDTVTDASAWLGVLKGDDVRVGSEDRISPTDPSHFGEDMTLRYADFMFWPNKNIAATPKNLRKFVKIAKGVAKPASVKSIWSAFGKPLISDSGNAKQFVKNKGSGAANAVQGEILDFKPRPSFKVT